MGGFATLTDFWYELTGKSQIPLR